MDAARQGIITPEMKAVAAKEYRTEEEIRELVAKGQVAICANKLHTCIDPNGVGSMLRTKINVNLGVSRDCKDYDIEMEKVMAAVNMGAEAIMDLSSHGNTQPFRRKLTSECPAMIGTVPVYDSVIHYQRDLATLTARDIDDRMGDARRKLDWEEQWACALDPETAKRIRDERKPEYEDTCSMCGKFCAVRSMNKALNNEMVDIL